MPTNDVSLKIERGARHALIGPNGAGKTTLINLLTGMLEPSAGTIRLDGDDITRLAPHRRVRRGIVRTFQINQLFGALTPLQSLALTVARSSASARGWWRPLGADAARRRRRAMRCCAQFRLDDVQDQRVAELAYGKRRLLEIAMALACRPRVLLLDEPVAGVPEGERQEIFDIVNALAGRGVGAADRARHGPRLQLRQHGSPCSSTARIFAEGDAASDRRRPARQGGLPRRRRAHG